MVLVVGDITVDLCAPIAALPAVGEDCLTPDLSLHCGGVGLNTAFGLARLGVPARLVSCVGRDPLADFVLQRAASAGIATTFVQRTEKATTGLFLTAISPNGQRTFIGSRGANAELRATENVCAALQDANVLLISAYVFLAQGSSDFADQLIDEAKRRGIWTLLDLGLAPCQQTAAKLRSVFAMIDTVMANLAEAEALTGQGDPDAVFSSLEQAGARDPIIKLGGEGCLIRDGARLCRVPPFTVSVMDTTGAGDAFNAGYIAGRMRGWAPAACALFANACGAAAATVVGAGENLPVAADVERLLKAASLPENWNAVRAQMMRDLPAQFGGAAATVSKGA